MLFIFVLFINFFLLFSHFCVVSVFLSDYDRIIVVRSWSRSLKLSNIERV